MTTLRDRAAMRQAPAGTPVTIADQAAVEAAGSIKERALQAYADREAKREAEMRQLAEEARLAYRRDLAEELKGRFDIAIERWEGPIGQFGVTFGVSIDATIAIADGLRWVGRPANGYLQPYVNIDGAWLYAPDLVTLGTALAEIDRTSHLRTMRAVSS